MYLDEGRYTILISEKKTEQNSIERGNVCDMSLDAHAYFLIRLILWVVDMDVLPDILDFCFIE